MPRINLLPWREELRQQRQKQFIQITLLLVLAVILVLIAAGQLIEMQTDRQNQRNTLIRTHIGQLNQEIQEVKALRQKREQLLEWIGIVNALQADRNTIVNVFNEIAHATRGQLYLTRIEKQGNLMTLEGEAATNRDISELMRHLARSETLQDPILTDVSTSNSDSAFNRFVLQIYQDQPDKPSNQKETQ